jgi:CCR4-NOT transcription complex subunit 2
MELKLWLTRDPQTPEMLYTKTAQFEKGVYTFWDTTQWCRVNKEFVLFYDALETPPSAEGSAPS